MDGTILVADDDRTIRTVVTQALTRAGCKVRSTSSVSTLWGWIEGGEGDVVVSDVMMPDGNGLELMPLIQKKRPELPVIIISAQNSVMTAIRASEVGAYDYIPKPFDLRELISKVNKALNKNDAAPEPANLDLRDTTIPMIGSSAEMQNVYRVIARVINTELNVMITGPSGSGKTLLGETLQKNGRRSGQRQATLAASQIDERGIGTIMDEFDRISEDKLGTILIEEIGDLKADAQTALLSDMQSSRFTKSSIRIVSTTSMRLDELIRAGSFREDLFYRLNVMPIVLPALGKRIDDIPELTIHFLRLAKNKGLPEKTISKEALQKLRGAQWPGNVRELENFIDRAIALSIDDHISEEFMSELLKHAPEMASPQFDMLPDKLSTSVEAYIRRYFDLHGDALPPSGLYHRILREFELPLIAMSLSATRGNQIKCAELLGINRNTLRKKINELDIHVTRSRKMM